MPSAAKWKLTDAAGKSFTWGRRELDDTLFESAAWESKATRARVLAMKPGDTMRRKGETLQRLGASKRAKNPAPSLANLGTMSEHGHVVELAVHKGDELEVHSWRARRPLLLWSPRQRALVFVHGLAMPAPRRGEPPRDDGAAATYERFEGRAASSWRDGVRIPAVKLRELGHAAHIAYRAPRWQTRGGKPGGVAEHPFGPQVRAYIGTSGRAKVYVIVGGRLRMTARGIEG